MPENAKRPDDPRGLTLSNESTPKNETAGDASPLRDVEAQMRRALGLAGVPRRGDAEQPVVTKPPHPANRFGLGGHKRRFAQDGEVPVTMLNERRDHPADAPVNRLEIAETAAAAERTAREKAERALAEAQATIHDLQTKLGHANLAQTEWQASARRDQDAAAAARAEGHATQERLSAIEEEYAEERKARQQADRAQRDAEAARVVAERRLRKQDLTAGAGAALPVQQPKRSPKARDTATAKLKAATRRGKLVPAGAEPEPVQWWLSPKQTKRRR